ncbi:yippee zinc-binding/DNA-binding /Mis18, centromere assembly-domain-containing protein [Calycina marina]|uniref:Yippee zinc-binding/DNA-binding /Mis18, centromere assembly-domain-containing protein n=1 Tax=Calycina marina TaxID=1763456 RepID=A0A9P7Z0Y6_9HELO|nr:yippee zinc-binding/DNA-binding /Mis18, centromere assembly-domain-containing protein [Calycina marina]
MAPERPPFPTYLLPSISPPLHQRYYRLVPQTTTSETHENAVPYLSSSPISSISTSPSSSPPSTSHIPYPVTSSLRTQRTILRCLSCATDIAFSHQIVSKGFTGRHGRAYLVSPPSTPAAADTLPNVRLGRSANRELLTGTHVVADVICKICNSCLGWKYVDAKDPAQKYKIGKFILETAKVVYFSEWELEEQNSQRKGEMENEDVVVFDSEDEDESQDLFAGVWDREIIMKRRARRAKRREDE